MLFAKPDSVLSYIGDKELLSHLVEHTAVACPVISPVFECVKVWCKLDKNGVLLFARSKDDVLLGGVTPTDVVSRFKNEDIRRETYDILCLTSECLASRWPFFDGSSAWILLEVLSPVFAQKAGNNERTVILRESARLSYVRGRVNSPMSEKVFTHMGKDFSYKGIQFNPRPTALLKSSSGTGFLTEMNQKDKLNEADIETFVQNIIEYNKDIIFSFGFPRGGIAVEPSYITGFDVLFKETLIRFPLLSQKDKMLEDNEGKTLFTTNPIWRR